MQIWVDADACPKVIKEIIFRAARRVAVTKCAASAEIVISGGKRKSRDPDMR